MVQPFPLLPDRDSGLNNGWMDGLHIWDKYKYFINSSLVGFPFHFGLSSDSRSERGGERNGEVFRFFL